jgi:putative DNA primase/helicase
MKPPIGYNMKTLLGGTYGTHRLLWPSRNEADQALLCRLCRLDPNDNLVLNAARKLMLPHAEWDDVDGYCKTSLANAREYVKITPEYRETHDGYAYNDTGNAMRLYDQHAGKIHYINEYKRFTLCDGATWETVETTQVERMVRELNERMRDAIPDVPNHATRKALREHVERSEQQRGVEQCVRALRSINGEVPKSITVFDAQPHVIPLANGIYDVQDGKFRAAQPSDYLMKVFPVAYANIAPEPRLWHAYLKSTFRDPALIQWIQKMVGYMMTGYTVDQLIFIFWGGPDTGKTTLTNVLSALMGDDYTFLMTPDYFLNTRHDGTKSYYSAQAYGKRLIYCSELDEKRTLAIGHVKALTGEEKQHGRSPYGNPFQYMTTAKPVIVTNHLPGVQGNDEAIWTRLCVVPFHYRILPTDEIPDFSDRLREELPGILRWALDGARMWSEEGLKDDMPPAVRDEHRAYREEHDEFGVWFDDHYEYTGCDDDKIEGATVYTAFKELHPSDKRAQKSFTSIVKNRYGVRVAAGGNGRSYYYGIRLR